MGIFRRRSKDPQTADVRSGDTAETDETAGTGDSGGTDQVAADTADTDGTADADGSTALAEELAADGDEQPLNRVRGPFDLAEAEAAERDGGEVLDRLDLGALRLVPVDGMQLRLEIDEAQQTVLSVHAVLGASSVQLQAFAAPRTMPVWPEIRTEIVDNVVAGGGTADVVRGELGRELLCRMPQQGPDGRTVYAQVRFAGVDGPRWFLRAVFSGPAAVDDVAAAPFVGLVRSAVVVRGDDAMPPREVLPLRLPQEAQEAQDALAAQEAEAAEAAAQADGDPALSDLKPFERGPEITEVR